LEVISPSTVKTLMAISSASMALCLGLITICESTALGYLILAGTGVGWSTTMVVPWYIVSTSTAGLPNPGVYNGLFNSSQCFPEIIISIVGAIILPLTDSNYRILFALGSVASLFNIYLTTRLIVPVVEHGDYDPVPGPR